jgi:hypothetical protein
MCIAILWAGVGRKTCANSVQACMVCKSCANRKVGADGVQKLCKDLTRLGVWLGRGAVGVPEGELMAGGD